MSDNRRVVDVAAANEEVVRELYLKLKATFEEFISERDGDVEFVDGFMAAHNFHKQVVLHLMDETGQSMWGPMSVDTFSQAVNKAIDEQRIKD
jgi:hypothetical protein